MSNQSHDQQYQPAPLGNGFAATTSIASSFALYPRLDSTNTEARRLIRAGQGQGLRQRVATLFAGGDADAAIGVEDVDAGDKENVTGVEARETESNAAESGKANAETSETGDKTASSTVPVSVVIADEQSAGRGRLDRSWYSQAQESFTASFVTCLPTDLVVGVYGAWLTTLVGVALLQAIADTVTEAGAHPKAEASESPEAAAPIRDNAASPPPPGTSPNDTGRLQLKWPNDLICGGKKVGGILAEVAAIEGSETAVIFGIGVNLFVPAASLPTDFATSLHLQYADLPDYADLRDQIASAITWKLQRSLTEFVNQPAAVIKELRETVIKNSYTLGRQVWANLLSGEIVTGEAVDILRDAGLAIRTDAGEIREIRTGDAGVMTD